jgi:hypothetical protein
MEGKLNFNEDTLRLYAAPLSETENQMCLNAIRMVRDALKELGFTDDNKMIQPIYADTYSYSLEMRSLDYSRKVKLFIQGSYANNTNVRTQSDVDIAVVQEEVFQTEYRVSSLCPQSDTDYNFHRVPPAAKSFKDEVQECLEAKFKDDVERKNKSIKIYGNTYRKDADTVPCRRYKDFRNDFSNNANNYIGGIVIFSDDGQQIINFPEQHIENGKKKNVETNHYYKKMVRILKKMRYMMSDNKILSANKVSSFGLESLLWNVPNDKFTKYTSYKYIFEDVVDYLYDNRYMITSYKEANGIKDLCPNSYDRENYTNFINDLKVFYQYE